MKEFIVSQAYIDGIYIYEGSTFGLEMEPELIRCKDCKHHKGYNCDRLYGFQDAFTFLDDDYCSRAERAKND